jgi:hypothetical protein
MLRRRDFRWRTRRASIAAEARFPGTDARAGGIPDDGHHGAPGEGGGVPGAGGRRARGVHRGRGHGEVVDALRPPLRISRDNNTTSSQIPRCLSKRHTGGVRACMHVCPAGPSFSSTDTACILPHSPLIRFSRDSVAVPRQQNEPEDEEEQVAAALIGASDPEYAECARAAGRSASCCRSVAVTVRFQPVLDPPPP